MADENGDRSQFEVTREVEFSPLVRAFVGIRLTPGDVVNDVLAR